MNEVEILLRDFRDGRARGLRITYEELVAHIDALDPRQAEAMRWYYLERVKTATEVGRKMGISPPAAHKLLKKGQTNLAARLSNQADEHARRHKA